MRRSFEEGAKAGAGRRSWWLLVAAGAFGCAVALAPSIGSADPGPGGDSIGACIACHLDYSVSKHQSWTLDGCFSCHVRDGGATRPIVDGTSTEKHEVLLPADDQGCATCHEPSPLRFVHPEVKAGHCTTCHDPHDASSRSTHLTTKPMAPLCSQCHEPDKIAHPHTIVARGECGGCHTVHGSSQPNLLVGDTEISSCQTCHPKEPQRFTHAPAAAGECAACHDPHGSDYVYNLVAPPGEVCLQCHPPKAKHTYTHAALTLGECTGCHDPHGSDTAWLLRDDPIGNVCFGCHDDDVSGRKVVHEPVASGNCSMCHDPHGAAYTKDLRAPANLTCAMCHPNEWRAKVLTPHQAVLADGCVSCHDPHGSGNSFALRKPTMDLCLQCHPSFDGKHAETTMSGDGHPLGARTSDPQRPGREVDCVSCHDPHGSNNPFMFYRAYERLALCVECHRNTIAPGTEVGESQPEIESEAARKRALERSRVDALHTSNGGAVLPAAPQ